MRRLAGASRLQDISGDIVDGGQESRNVRGAGSFEEIAAGRKPRRLKGVGSSAQRSGIVLELIAIMGYFLQLPRRST